MTLTEAYEAIIKLSHPEKRKRYDDWCHGQGGETLMNSHDDVTSESLPSVWQDLMPDGVSEKE